MIEMDQAIQLQHSVRKHDFDERSIFVLDGLFDEQLIRMIYHFMSRLPFTLSEYGTEQTKHAPHWKHEFDLVKRAASRQKTERRDGAFCCNMTPWL